MVLALNNTFDFLFATDTQIYFYADNTDYQEYRFD